MKRILSCSIGVLVAIAMPVIAESSLDTLHLKLEDAKLLCRENNQTILIAKERIVEKSAEIGIARAAFLPSLSLQGSYTRLGEIPAFMMEVPEYTITPLNVYDFNGFPAGYTEPITVMTGVDSMDLEMGASENYLLRGSLQQPLFTWGTLLNSYRIATINYDIEKENYRKTVNDVMLQVTQSYLGAYLTQGALELMRESYDLMEEHVSQVRALYENGMAQRLDLLRANVELTNLRTQVLRAERDREIAFSALKMSIGVSDDVNIVLDVDLDYRPYNVALEEAFSYALNKRPDFMAFRLTKDLTEKALAIEKAQNKPSLALIYNYDYKKPLSFSEEGWGTDWNITLALSMQIFQGGSHYARIKKRRSQLRQLDFSLTQFEEAIRLEVKTNFLLLEQEEEILSYQEENVAQAEEALELAEEQYNNGLITNLEYMDTQLALTRSKLEWLSSLVSYSIAKEKLLVSMGM